MFEIVASDFLKMRRSKLTHQRLSLSVISPQLIKNRTVFKQLRFLSFLAQVQSFIVFLFLKLFFTSIPIQKCVLCSHAVQPGRVGLDIMLVCTDCKKSHHPRKLLHYSKTTVTFNFRVYGDKAPDDSPHTQVQLAVYRLQILQQVSFSYIALFLISLDVGSLKMMNRFCSVINVIADFTSTV